MQAKRFTPTNRNELEPETYQIGWPQQKAKH